MATEAVLAQRTTLESHFKRTQTQGQANVFAFATRAGINRPYQLTVPCRVDRFDHFRAHPA